MVSPEPPAFPAIGPRALANQQIRAMPENQLDAEAPFQRPDAH